MFFIAAAALKKRQDVINIIFLAKRLAAKLKRLNSLTLFKPLRYAWVSAKQMPCGTGSIFHTKHYVHLTGERFDKSP